MNEELLPVLHIGHKIMLMNQFMNSHILRTKNKDKSGRCPLY